MDRQIPVANKKLSRKWQARSHQLHRQKIKSMRPSIDNKPPPHYSHMTYNAKKAVREEQRYSEIERANSILLDRMSKHMRGSGTVDHLLQPKGPASLNRLRREAELRRINEENQRLFQRLLSQKSTISRVSHQRDFRKSRKDMVRLCELPVVLGKVPPTGDDSMIDDRQLEALDPQLLETSPSPAGINPAESISISPRDEPQEQRGDTFVTDCVDEM
eukprot:gnl/Dysnectes_brevis/2207_a2573_2372.p1 GENE.gnl/Dysnectes_brevis/2207_a2573_2372~~gnl/Dysnectes_brevis/2207_a2573_2372.p1  ORF type:complete len:217 (+),score=15.74 gnl/Dysnectes_brevis/2207_a2573_2372:119-769(+)